MVLQTTVPYPGAWWVWYTARRLAPFLATESRVIIRVRISWEIAKVPDVRKKYARRRGMIFFFRVCVRILICVIKVNILCAHLSIEIFHSKSSNYRPYSTVNSIRLLRSDRTNGR